MPVTEEVKYLKSIDGTLKDILKELKRQGRKEAGVSLNIDGEKYGRPTEVDTQNLTRQQRALLDY